jgi:hypothetical protein
MVQWITNETSVSSKGKISSLLKCSKQICRVHNSRRLIFFVHGCHVLTTKQSLNFLSTQYIPIKIYSNCYIISRFQSGMVNAALLLRRLTRGFSEFGQTHLQKSSLPPLNNLSFCLSKRTCTEKYKDVGKIAALWLCSWNIYCVLVTGCTFQELPLQPTGHNSK